MDIYGLGVGVGPPRTLPPTQLHFAGNDLGREIAAAMNDLPATGGTVDARGLEGSQTISSDIFNNVTKPLEIIWAQAPTHFPPT